MKKVIIVFLIIFLRINIDAQCWQSISCGSAFSFGKKTDGTMCSWGSNSFGQLGNIFLGGWYTPFQLPTPLYWKEIKGGWEHSVGIKTDGTLWTMGYNNKGQLGNGTNTDSNLPIQIGLANNWKNVAAGAYHSLGLKTDGTIWAWGNNYDGQVGDGTYVNKNVPVQVGVNNNWQSIYAGYYQSYGIKTDGTLWAWGTNAAGELGDGTNIAKGVPTQVGISNDWQFLGGGAYHMFGVKNNGTLWAWGYNYEGQIGDGTIGIANNKNSPIQIGNDTWLAIGGGVKHTVGIKTGGTLWAWGDNQYGQLGDGTIISKLTPFQIGNDNNWNSLAIEAFATLALKTDNTIKAWGANSNGQLGDGTSYSYTETAVQVICSNVNVKEAFINSDKIYLFPNPASNEIIIKNADNKLIEEVEIFDGSGKLIIASKKNYSTIDISKLVNGIYLLKFVLNNKNYSYKFLKE